MTENSSMYLSMCVCVLFCVFARVYVCKGVYLYACINNTQIFRRVWAGARTHQFVHKREQQDLYSMIVLHSCLYLLPEGSNTKESFKQTQ